MKKPRERAGKKEREGERLNCCSAIRRRREGEKEKRERKERGRKEDKRRKRRDVLRVAAFGITIDGK